MPTTKTRPTSKCPQPSLTSTPSRFPYFSADVLASNAMILQALIQGGWNSTKEEEEEKERGSDNELNDLGEDNPLVKSILKNRSDESGMVQQALNSQTVSLLLPR